MISGTGEVNDLDGDGLPAFNYNPLANINDGSCTAVISGCTNQLACNYNSSANIEDNISCSIPTGCEICSGEEDGTGFILNNDSFKADWSSNTIFLFLLIIFSIIFF